MILDSTLLFSDDQAVTTTANSTNIIDLGNDNSKALPLNEKGNIKAFAQVSEEDFAGATSLAVSLTCSDSETFVSSSTVFSTAAIPVAELVAGYMFPMGALPPINKQYLRMTYTQVGTAMSAGKITSGLVFDTQTNR